MMNHYEILDIPQTASYQEVKSAWKKKISKVHPDRFQKISEKERAHEEFVHIMQAYSVLINPIERERYDQSIGLKLQQPAWRQGYQDKDIQSDIEEAWIAHSAWWSDNASQWAQEPLLKHAWMSLVILPWIFMSPFTIIYLLFNPSALGLSKTYDRIVVLLLSIIFFIASLSILAGIIERLRRRIFGKRVIAFSESKALALPNH